MEKVKRALALSQIEKAKELRTAERAAGALLLTYSLANMCADNTTP